MFGRQRGVAACLALGFVGLSVLFLHAKSITPETVAIAEIGGDDAGMPVRVRGHVHRVSTTDDGNAVIVLIDYADFATIRVIARPRAIAQPAQVSPGASVEIVGVVFGSGGTLQIFSERDGDVTVRSGASTNRLPLEFVARNAARIAGHRILVSAELVDIRTVVDPRHARLLDDGGEVWAFAAGGWSDGVQDVEGRLAMASNGRCELFVAEETQVTDVTLRELAACPPTLLGLSVRIRDVLVEPGETVGTSLLVSDLGDGAEYRITAFVREWDWRRGQPILRTGDLVTLEGTVEYQATEARWHIVMEMPPRR